MNARPRAHISGQVSAQSVPQASSKTQKGNSLAPQMTVEPRTLDPDHIAARKPMMEKIFQLIQKISSSDWDGKLPEIVRNMEERTFRTASKVTYMNLLRDERPLESILKTLISTDQLTQFAPSSTRTMLIPTPGMTKKGKTKTVISGGMEIPNIAAVSTAAMTQTTAIMEDFPPSTNALADAGNKSSYGLSDGSTSNGHKCQVTNFGQSGGSSLVSSCNVPRQLTQMIPTPGFTKPQISINSECSTGASFSNTESTIVPMSQHNKKCIESRDNHHLDNLGGQVSSETRSNVKQNFTSYGFSNDTANGDMGLIRSNMQLNASTTSERFRNAPANGISSKPLQHQLDQQHHKSRLPTPFSQQMLTSTADGRSIMAAEMAGSETFQTSGSSVRNNLNSVSLHKSRTNSDMLNQQASLQSLRRSPSIRFQVVDHQQNMNFQSSHSTNEHVLHSQQQMQQFHQQSNQSYAEFVQNSHQLQGKQKGLQSQPYMSTNNILRQPPLTSNFGDHMPPANTIVTQSEILPPQSIQQVQHRELQSLYHQNATAVDHSKDVRFLGQLPAQDFPNHVSEGSQQLFQLHQLPNEFASNVGAFSDGSQTDKLLRAQCHSQPRQQSQMLSNSLNELILEDMQSILGQEEGQHPYNPLEGSISSSADTLSHYTEEELQNYHKQCRVRPRLRRTKL